MDLKILCKDENPDLNGVYHRLKTLFYSYLITIKGEKYHLEVENTVEEIVLHLIVEKKIYKKIGSPMVTWNTMVIRNALGFYKATNKRTEDTPAVKETFEILAESEPSIDPLKKTDRDFYAFTNRRAKELLRTETFNNVIDQIGEFDPVLSRFLNKQVKRDLKTFSTRDLLAIYKRYVKTSVKEYKRCKKTMNNVFRRVPPSKRTLAGGVYQ